MDPTKQAYTVKCCDTNDRCTTMMEAAHYAYRDNLERACRAKGGTPITTVYKQSTVAPLLIGGLGLYVAWKIFT